MYFAFKKTPPTNPTLFQRIACKGIKIRLVSQYSHGGLVIRNPEGTLDLYHVTTKKGLHKVQAGEWNPDGWDLFDVGGDDEAALALFEQYEGCKYDWFSLITFVGPRVTNSNYLYCYEWMYLAYSTINPNFKVTPELLMTLVYKEWQ